MSAAFLTLSIGFVSAQNYDSRLLKKFDHGQLVSMEQNDPSKLKRYEYALDNGVYVTDLPTGKETDLPVITVNGDNPTFADLGLDIIKSNQYFKIEGTDKMLVVKSIWVLDNELGK
jgi:hypothetical protein